MECPLMANNGLPGHVAGTSALPLTADIRVPKSAFWRNMSALPPAADLPDGVAEGPFLTRRRHRERWARLPDLPHMIGTNCPKMDALGNDPCGAHYRDLA